MEKKLNDGCFENGHILQGAIVCISCNFTNTIHDLHSLYDLPKHRVLPIKIPVINQIDEKLTPSGVRTGISHWRLILTLIPNYKDITVIIII